MNDSDIAATTLITPDLFWHVINILITKPHVVNKRLWGCKILGRFMCASNKAWESLLPVKFEDTVNIDVFLQELSRCMESELVPHDNSGETELVLTELLPKNYGDKHAFQLVYLQKLESTATFYDVSPSGHCQYLCPDFSYRFYLENNVIKLSCDDDNKESKCYPWLLTTVLPQVNKWSQEITSTQQSVTKSLALVPHDQYYIKYNVLKEKYGKELVKIWPECTDPSKFVYEDIAIATYLLLLWGSNDECAEVTSQKFVDMGCGNGLLVYILTMEGHNGYGIDVRKRKIWDMYPKNVQLLEKTITPSNINTFSDIDWVIGNHSDELTPWIPVIAAKSSFKCKFFLLPCCAYNFDGSKYQRINSSKTQYTEYLEYIQKLSEDCGFHTYTDRLKIPSTKRICFVGNKRKHKQEEFNKYCESIDILIQSSDNGKAAATDNFKAREPTEKVRNCTRVDKNVIESIVSCVAKYILEGCQLDSPNWSTGKTIDISEVVSLLSSNTLKVLKSECGGLQTLLKNNNHIFKVRNGQIQFQYPRSVEEINRSIMNNKKIKSSIKIKVKECWFYKNHPQGCPLSDVDCSFVH
ncbi:probable tRNA (uracil-O(2)-)-methyltransferase [Epargyreus clarus]|uniref:probable tRNA (uracil-O(2)-)-methyltransferase n=1 Tax=Epargyreus clarus TaxID=520877 RepID=UPI003C2D0AC2